MIALMFLRMSKFKHLKLVCFFFNLLEMKLLRIYLKFDRHIINSLMVFYLNTNSSIAKQDEKHVENNSNAIKNAVGSVGPNSS